MQVKVTVMVAAALLAILAIPALGQQQPAPQQPAPQQQQQQPQQPPPAEQGSTIILFAGDPFSTGSVTSFATVNTTAEGDLSAVTFVDIRVCNRGHVFAVERIAAAGQTLANTMVRTRAGSMTLAEVVARLESACASGTISRAAAELGANAAVTGSMQTGARTHVFLMASGEGGMRPIVAVADLGTPVSAELAARGITHVRLQSGTSGHVFAVARLAPAGQPIGNTMVQINGQTMTLAELSARLEAARRGEEDVVLFTTGPTTDAVVVGMTRLPVTDLSARVGFTGATHAMVILRGQPRVFVITTPSFTTLADIPVRHQGEAVGLRGSLFVEVIPVLQLTL